jgi:hypothetical protein
MNGPESFPILPVGARGARTWDVTIRQRLKRSTSPTGFRNLGDAILIDNSLGKTARTFALRRERPWLFKTLWLR